ncbi:bcl2-associated agonist of cell death [Colossoma macropomum]|uniref:bcl2-associated agonist of cell death n=1 Tax=Colossoma macropomum TaxID=42526 RepID=UPI0018655392|nr:bcl2-associated agonist of cell death [Colossoma macropomum]
MSNQYLQKLRRARFNCEEEGYKKVIKTLTEEKGTLFNPLCWNSSRTTACTMEKHSEDDISTMDDQDESNWSETGKNGDSPQLDSEHSMPSNISPASPDELSEVGGRVRLYSESQVYTVSRWQDSEDGLSAEDGGSGDGAPFRGRSQSAPAALWKAKKYGRQLRRMSDEFDTWLDKGDIRRASSPGKQTNRGWFSFLWGSKEEEGRE